MNAVSFSLSHSELLLDSFGDSEYFLNTNLRIIFRLVTVYMSIFILNFRYIYILTKFRKNRN